MGQNLTRPGRSSDCGGKRVDRPRLSPEMTGLRLDKPRLSTELSQWPPFNPRPLEMSLAPVVGQPNPGLEVCGLDRKYKPGSQEDRMLKRRSEVNRSWCEEKFSSREEERGRLGQPVVWSLVGICYAFTVACHSSRNDGNVKIGYFSVSFYTIALTQTGC